MFDLPDRWVWDFWVVRDGASYELFFLQAPRALGDPDLRHRNASVGHATSTDLVEWTLRGDALLPQPPPAFDDLATWTGSLVRGVDGTWRMFTTGLSLGEDGQVQRIGVSTSADLASWQRHPRAVLEADPRWYQVRDGKEPETHWRDPWVLLGPDGRWHLYATARAVGTTAAAVAHATSPDLETWSVEPPVTRPSRRFEWAEVVSLAEVDGRWALVFSCLPAETVEDGGPLGGVWSLPVAGPVLEPASVDLDLAVPLTTPDLYVGKVVVTPAGRSCLMAFVNRDADGAFRGGLTDPLPLRWRDDGAGLELEAGPTLAHRTASP